MLHRLLFFALCLNLCFANISCQSSDPKNSTVKSVEIETREQWLGGWMSSVILSRDKNDFAVLFCKESKADAFSDSSYVPCEQGRSYKMPFQLFQDTLLKVESAVFVRLIEREKKNVNSTLESQRKEAAESLSYYRAKIKEKEKCIAAFMKLIKDNTATEFFTNKSFDTQPACEFEDLGWEAQRIIRNYDLENNK